MNYLMDVKELRLKNIDFMIGAAQKICFDPNFSRQLSIAYSDMSNSEVLYGGLQEFNPPLGSVVIDPYSVMMLDQEIGRDIKLLYKFMEKVHSGKNEYFTRKDCSLTEVPFRDKDWHDFSIFLDIFGYTKTSGDFGLVKSPLEVSSETHLEMLAHFGIKSDEEDSLKSLEEQEKRILDFQKEYLEKHFGKPKRKRYILEDPLDDNMF